MGGERGHSVVEMLAALAVCALLAAAATPSLSGLMARARMRGAAAEVASLLRTVRSRAIAESRSLALVFERDAAGWRWELYADGDGDGIRTADLNAGVDFPLAPPRRLADTWPGVDFGVGALVRMRRLPPSTGFGPPPADPVQFGASDIISFSPRGDASSGTLFLADAGGAMSAIVLFGPTLRVRVYSYDTDREEWTS